MASPRAIRGRQVDISLYANSGPGTALQPVKVLTVTDITKDELGTEDSHQYVGSQGAVYDKDTEGYGGTFKMEIADFEMSRLEETIATRQYQNLPIQDIRLTFRFKIPNDGAGVERVRTATHNECTLKFSTAIPSRQGFVTTTVSWKSGGLPSYNER